MGVGKYPLRIRMGCGGRGLRAWVGQGGKSEALAKTRFLREEEGRRLALAVRWLGHRCTESTHGRSGLTGRERYWLGTSSVIRS